MGLMCGQFKSIIEANIGDAQTGRYKMLLVLLLWGALSAANPGDSVAKPDFDQWWDYDHPEQTEKKFREILPKAKESGDVGYYAELLTQLARSLGLQQKFDDAHVTLDQVKAILPKAGETAAVRYLLERGRTYNSDKHKNLAEPLFEQAAQRAEKAHLDFYWVDALHMLAIVAPTEKQASWNEKAVAVAEKSSNARARNWLGSLYNNMGWTLFDQKAYDSALVIFKKAQAFREQQGTPENIIIAKYSVGKTLRYLNRIDEAMAIQRQLEEDWKKIGRQDGYVYEELAECYNAKKQLDQARRYFALAYELLSKDLWLPRDEPERLARMKELGGVK
jgi:tetratricopeptide (TPR) repeat protein